MKHFGFYVTPGKVDRAGNSTDTVTVFQIRGNIPVIIGTVPRAYRTPAQAAIDTAIGAGKLSKIYNGKSAARLYNDGIANFHEL